MLLVRLVGLLSCASLQPSLLEIPEQPPRPVLPPDVVAAAPPKLKPIDRSQGLLRPMIVE